MTKRGNKVQMEATKKKPRGGARIRDARSEARVRKLDGQQVLLREITKHFGGILKLAELIQKRTGDKDFHYQNFVNWRNRKGVPLRSVKTLADALDVSPFALNYSGMKRMTSKGKSPSWESVVRGCKMLGPETLKYILRFKAPE